LTNATIYQCIPCRDPVKTAELIKGLVTQMDIDIVLDLEDSIQHVTQPDLNDKLKQQARYDLKKILSLVPPSKNYRVRVNGFSSAHFEEDVQAIQSVGDQITGIVLPKVESHQALDDAIKILKPYVKQFSIIIESTKGLQSVAKILGQPFRPEIHFVIFGNYDYQLDKGIYPIKDQNDYWYWNTIGPLITQVESLGYHFANSPYTNLRDLKTLINSVTELEKRCLNKFGLISLHRTQSVAYNKYLNGIKETYHNHESKRILKQKKVPNSIFTFTTDGKIITPQETILAQRQSEQ
jgi:citrate lyase beta subunit